MPQIDGFEVLKWMRGAREMSHAMRRPPPKTPNAIPRLAPQREAHRVLIPGHGRAASTHLDLSGNRFAADCLRPRNGIALPVMVSAPNRGTIATPIGGRAAPALRSCDTPTAFPRLHR